MLSGERVAAYCEKNSKPQIYTVGRMQSFSVLKQVVYMYSNVWVLKGYIHYE
jgi:hypothetical protein